MDKIVLNEVQGGYNLDAINSNFAKIETALNEKVLYRTNPTGSTNVMNQTLDMNGYSIINQGSITSGGVPAPAPVLAEDVVFNPSGTISATNVQDAITELMNEGSGSGGASTAAAVSYSPTAPLTGTNVQTALDQLAVSPKVTSFNTRSGAVTLTSADVTAALGFTPSAGSGASVLNVAALRAAASVGGTVVSTRGYYTNGDGGGATFYLDTADTTSADNGGSIIVATDGGRWKMGKAQTYSVRQFGAKGDGTTDDTTAFQAFATWLCIDGKRGYIPGGKYRLTQRVQFHNTCELFGDGWKDVRDMTGPTTRDWTQAQIVGTIIYADYTNTDAAHSSMFYFDGNSPIVRDMEFEAKQPTPGAGWVTNNTPYAIDCYRPPFYEQGANGVLFENIMLRNLKDGINMVGASRGTMRDIYGQCFGSAIKVTQCYDVLRLEDIHLNWPFYSGQADVVANMDLNGHGIVFGRVDNPILHNIFIFGGKVGIKTYVDTASGGGKTERMQITNMGLDNIGYGVYSEDCVSMDISNFYVYNRANLPTSRGIYNLAVLGGGQVPLRLNLTNGDFQGSQAEAIRLEVPGKAQLTNIRIRDYNGAASTYPGIAAYAGVVVQYVNLTVENTSTTPITQAFGGGTITSGTGVNGVSSFNSRTGVVNLTSADVTTALGYTPASGSTSLFTGVVRSAGNSPLPPSGTGVEVLYDTGLDAGFIQGYDRTGAAYKDINLAGRNLNFKSGTAGTTQAAFDTNGYFLLGYGGSVGSYKLQVNGDAIVSGAFYGTTATAGDNSTKFATTAFVTAAIAAGSGSGNFATTIRSTNTSNPASGTGVEVNYDTGLAAGFCIAYNRSASQYVPMNFGGSTITFKTGTAGTNQGFIDTSGNFILGFGTSQGAYKLQVSGDMYTNGAIYCATPSTGTTGTRVATCDYVINKLSGSSVTSFNSRTGAVSLSSGDVTGALGFTPVSSSSPSFSGIVGNSGTFRSTSTSTPGSGVGLEMNYDTGLSAGFVIAYNRSSSAYVPINLGGSTITFKAGSGSNVAFFDTNGSLMIGYGTSNGSSYKLQVNSQIFASNATIATSDARVKENVVPLEDGAIDLVNKLRPVAFDFKRHAVHDFATNRQVGFIAQEVQEVLADKDYAGSVVHTNDDGAENLMGIADSKLIPLLVKAIQELNEKVKALEAAK